MYNVKKRKILKLLDVLILIISVVALIVLTVVFRLIDNDIRYLFLVGDFYIIYTFTKTLASMDNGNSKSINSECKVSNNLGEQISL